MHPSSERDNKIYHVAVPEMPTSGDLKSGDCLFFTTPPPRNFNGISYMMYILSKFEIIKSQTESALLFTKYSIFIVDVKSGRFMYQSGRAGDEAKRPKSPAKSGRVGNDCCSHS